MKALHKKLLNIAAEMGRLPKNGYNAFHKYKYVLEADAMDKFRELCVKHGVMVLPSLQLFPSSEIGQAAINREGDVTRVVMSYSMVDVESGEEAVVIIPGDGQDKGDKGVYKAITGSYKYFIMKTFMVPSGDDPERDSPSKNAAQGSYGVSRGTPVRPPDSSAPRQQTLEPGHDIPTSEEQMREQISEQLMRICDMDAEKIAEILEASSEWWVDGKLKRAGVRNLNELSYARRGRAKYTQAEVVLGRLKKLDRNTIEQDLLDWKAGRS